MSKAPRYNVLKFLGQESPGYATQNAHAVVAIVRMATPVSFDRSKLTGSGGNASVDTSPEKGVGPRGDNGGLLLLSDDIVAMQVQRSKSSYVKQAAVTIKGPRSRLMATVLPGDWALAWLVPSQVDHDRVVKNIQDGKPAVAPEDGLRLVGRVHQVRKRVHTSDQGTKDVTYVLQLVGFNEFGAQLYYDFAAATSDIFQQSVGGWMARVGLQADAWFKGASSSEARKNNINLILPDILQMVLGKGVSKSVNVKGAVGVDLAPAAIGGGAGEEAPNAYVVPSLVGKLLGQKPNGVLAYADLLNVAVGGEVYEAAEDQLDNMTPDSTYELSGTFLPAFPQLVNTPFWEVVQHYLNPSINEMYTCIRMTDDGTVAPTLVVRQMPFTTDAFEKSAASIDDVTPFLSLPRWVIPSSLVINTDVGRSDTTRTNLVHVYGSAQQYAANLTTTDQIVASRPVRDDLDVQRSGPRPLMMTVECAIDNQYNAEAGKWMALIADRAMGSHLTLNGTLECIGIPGPVAEGDNIENNGIAYQIEDIDDVYQKDVVGVPRWRTILRLSNGVLVDSLNPLHYYGIDEGGQVSLEASDPGSTTVGQIRSGAVETGSDGGVSGGIPSGDIVTSLSSKLG